MNFSEMNINEVSPLPEGRHFDLLSYGSCSHMFWFEFLEQNCFSMLFLLNSPERFTCTVQQSKAKGNKQGNPWLVNVVTSQLFTHKCDSRNLISRSQFVFAM